MLHLRSKEPAASEARDLNFGIIGAMESKKPVMALIAHDNKKAEMVAWAMKHKHELDAYDLCGTGHTAKMVEDAIGREVVKFKSGPLGGDLEIGAEVAKGNIQKMVFFWDPLQAQPHDPDVKALMRIVAVYNVPFATNEATADCLLK